MIGVPLKVEPGSRRLVNVCICRFVAICRCVMYNQWKGVQPRTAFVVYFVFRWVLKALIFKERFKGSK